MVTTSSRLTLADDTRGYAQRRYGQAYHWFLDRKNGRIWPFIPPPPCITQKKKRGAFGGGESQDGTVFSNLKTRFCGFFCWNFCPKYPENFVIILGALVFGAYIYALYI